VLDRIGDRAIALLPGATLAGGFDVFRQTNEFHYLSGVEVPRAYLLLDGRRRRTVLFSPQRDPGLEQVEGPVRGAADDKAIQAACGADDVRPTADLAESLSGAAVAYLPLRPGEGAMMCAALITVEQAATAADPWDRRPSREDRLAEEVRRLLPSAEVRDLCPILDGLRIVKSPREVEVMRRAGQLAAAAVTEAMRSTRPGVVEHQLAAVADYVFHAAGARRASYRPIVAGGPNAWYPHYWRNDRALVDGELVLFDYAPDVAYYTSDIGRMWPVGGTYLPWQRELYGFMAEYHKVLLGRIRPGVLAKDISGEAAAEMRSVLDGWTFSKPVHREAARRTLDFAGHLSHPVGMSVHDPGDYRDGPLRPGTVLAVDPQMWVPEDRLYIRVEDTVAVTDTGVEVLTADAPLELDDVERLVQQGGGLLERFPPIPGQP
jgi:Xaa-Pro aminopeptidase